MAKEVLDATGNVVVKMRPTVSGHDERIDPNTVDITGATWTSRCVENLLQFWLSEQGFGPFLARVRDQGVWMGWTCLNLRNRLRMD